MSILEVHTVFSQQDLVGKMIVGKDTLHANTEMLSQQKSIEKSLKTKEHVSKSAHSGESSNLSDNPTAIINLKNNSHHKHKQDEQKQEFEIVENADLGKKFNQYEGTVIDLDTGTNINITT